MHDLDIILRNVHLQPSAAAKSRPPPLALQSPTSHSGKYVEVQQSEVIVVPLLLETPPDTPHEPHPDPPNPTLPIDLPALDLGHNHHHVAHNDLPAMVAHEVNDEAIVLTRKYVHRPVPIVPEAPVSPSGNRYSKHWTSAQISRDVQRRSPRRQSPRNLRDREKIKKPKRFRSKSPSVVSSHRGRGKAKLAPRGGSQRGSQRGSSPLRQTQRPHRNPLVCHNCDQPGHTSLDCGRRTAKCGSCNKHGHIKKYCRFTKRHSTDMGRGRSKDRRH